MKIINLVLCALIISSTSIAQGEVQIIGEATIFVEGNQLDLNENNPIQINSSNEIVQLSKGTEYVQFNTRNGLRIFHFEREGLYDRMEYVYLLTDRNRNFLCEIQFYVREDGENCINRIKEITGYNEQYANR